MSDNFNFHKEEYLALRREIEISLQQFSQLRRYSLIGTAFAFAWIANQDFEPTILRWLAWCVPLIIPFCGYLIMRSKSDRLGMIGEYIKKVENLYLEDCGNATGWENNHNGGTSKAYTADKIFWWALIVASLAITILGGVSAA